jgi:hypothetical protein
MAFSAAGLTAGLNPQNRCLSDGSMVQRGRKQYPRKSKLDVLITALSVLVLAVNDPGFGGMRLQLALCQSRLKRGLEGFGFLLTPTVHQSVIRIPTPRQVGMCPLHPKVESIVQEEIGKHWAYHSPNAKGNFQFERIMTGWRGARTLDLRHKR